MNRPTWLVLLAVLPILIFALAACGGDDDDTDAPTGTGVSEPLPTDTDVVDDVDVDSVRIEIVSPSLSYSPGVIDAPEATEFTIVYENAQNGVQHNLAIYLSEEDATGGGDPIAATTVEQGPDTQELSVGPLPAGEYFVWCVVHTAAMTATLSIE